MQHQGRRQRGIQVGDVLGLASAVTVGLLALIYEGRSGVPWILPALAFTLFVPVRAIVSNWPRMARWPEAAAAMVFSLASLGLLATASLWVHACRPMTILLIEAWISLTGLSVGISRRHERWPWASAR
ncbi:MAG TPA: hypothetical protein VIV12_14300 [Streptosporangiaceae bacterium]